MVFQNREIKMVNKKQQGGYRRNARQPLKHPDEGPRKTQPINLSPSNFAFLREMGRGKHDYINALLLKERGLKNAAENED